MKTLPAFSASLLVGCMLVLSASARAQTAAGVIGQRYIGLSFFSEKIRDRDIANGTGGGFGLNVPLTTHLDFAAGGSAESFPDYSVRDRRAFAGLTAYHDFIFLKAFADASVGGTWQSSKVNGTAYRANDGLYAFGVGFEAPFTDVSAVFGRVGVSHYFERERGHYWTYAAGVNHWFNEKLGATVSVTFYDQSSITYTLGVNVRF